jgi:UDP-2,3-diacylglucosamine hydrolase
MKLAFISDLHLSEKTFASNQVFYSLMNKWLEEIDALYILGDFFDHWIGDDDKNSFISDMETTLRLFSAKKPIYFIHGNHDFGIGKDFANRTGVKIIPDCSTIDIADNRILISHGDTFCTLDKSYQRFKKIIRNPIIMTILRKTPLSWRHKLKLKLEQESSKQFNQKPIETYLVVNETIRKIAQKNFANIVIHGHTHNPGRYIIENNGSIITRLEIPDWSDRDPGGYIMLDDNNIKIHLIDNS